MDRVPTLALRYGAEPAFDARGLFLAGLEHLRALAGRTWTDHNLHDPGITILELLAYALTELSYRAQFPAADLVAGPQADRQFWRARDALPCEPLTADDYRRLLIDLRGVRNAWVLPHGLTVFADTARRELRRTDPGTPGVRPVVIEGLFDVRLDFMDHVNTDREREAVIADARALLARHRNLCQAFVEVDAVTTVDVAVCAEIELEREVDAALVGAAIMAAWGDTLAPQVPNFSLAERQAQGAAVHEIFEGPLLAHGFIGDEDLAASGLRGEVLLSDLVAATMAVPGVAAVRDLTANALDAEGIARPRPEAWRVPLPAGARARMATAAGRLVLHKRGVPVIAWSFDRLPPRVAAELDRLHDAARRKVETPRADEWPLPAGRDRGLAAYCSVQHHFPALYGLAGAPLPASAPPLRHAQAAQLAGYLLLFDQWMANLGAQLAHAGQVLSVDPAHLRALRASFEDEAPDAHARHQQAQHVELPAPHHRLMTAERAADLAHALESRAEAAARWQAALDHLLARVGEDFGAYLDVMHTAFGAHDAQAIGDRCRFLEDAPTLARERGLAYDASAAPSTLWNATNVSGLERRIARLLGIADASRRNLAGVSFDTYAEIDEDRSDEFRWRVRHRVSHKILLSSSTHYATPAAAREEMWLAIARAQEPEGIRREVADDGRHYFNVVDGTGEVIGRRIEYWADAQAIEAAIASMAAYLREHYSGEGMYCIEGLALRLVDDTDRATICTDPACADCQDDDDPFSYRLHFVLPAEAGRFRHAGFRAFAEQVIRAETPAHILPKVCWVDHEDMAAVEGAYRNWITLGRNASAKTKREFTAALRDVLARAKNVYPAHPLIDCTSDEEKPYFVLGRHALGTQNKE